jgi:hypothetical protein
VLGLGFVKAQGPGNRSEDFCRNTREVPTFHSGVVVRAHPRQQGNLIAARARCATTPVRFQPHLLRGQLGAWRAQEPPIWDWLSMFPKV